MKTINYNYASLSQGNFLEKLGLIVFCLSSNLNFPDLPVSVADISAKKAEYEKALDKSRLGDHSATIQAKGFKAELNLMLKKDGIYVNLTSNGDELMLESSGYDFSKDRVKKKKPDLQILDTDRSGMGKVIIARVEGAVAYQVEIHADPIPEDVADQRWMRQPMTTKTYQWLNDIEPGKVMYLRYYSVSPDREEPPKGPYRFTLS